MTLLPKYTVLFMVFGLMLTGSCARVGQLDGGPKDEQPPRLDSLLSTPNYQTRFTQKTVKLHFDEWLRLHDVGNEVTVSPPLLKRPDISLRGKTVIFTFDEEEKLRPNTTYTIHFGKAIQDLTENNPATGLQFVFSTGDKIDSLQFSGQVVDALTGQPVEKASVFLYDSHSDSVLLLERPHFLSRSDAAGNFVFRNMRAGFYKIFAVEEVGSTNLRWDAHEKLGFMTEKVWVGDTAVKPHILRLSKQTLVHKIVSIDAPRFGVVRVKYSKAQDVFFFPQTALPNVRFLTEPAGDSILIWYDVPVDSLLPAWSFTLGADTVKVRGQNRTLFFKNKNIAFADSPSASFVGRRRQKGNEKPSAQIGTPVLVKNVTHRPNQTALPLLNLPIVALDLSKIEVWKNDTFPRASTDFQVWIDSISPRKLHFRLKKADPHPHRLLFLPTALTDFWGGHNRDTLIFTCNFIEAQQLGGLSIVLENLTVGEHYVLQVLQNDFPEAETAFMAASALQRVDFQHLPIAELTLRLIFDTNKNKRWDGGNFLKQQLPEMILNRKMQALKAGNWDVEVKWNVRAAQK